MAVIHPQILVRLNHKDRLARSFAALDGQFPLFDPGIRVAEKFKLNYRKILADIWPTEAWHVQKMRGIGNFKSVQTPAGHSYLGT